MLAQAGHALTARGLRFSDVVRTWIHVRDIEHNHAAFNQARNRYYDEQHLPCLPASTCVEGRVLGAESPVAMDLYAVGKSPDVEVTAIAPGSMGEATAHGSAFTRGSLLHEPGRRWLYVSGMASLDARGDVVCPGDVQGQWRRIFDNAGALLDEAGMGLGDVVNAKAYLKHAADYDGFLQSAVSTGLSLDVPTAVVVADICRPQGLCELELCAVRAD
jgi:enamine deaminase RidA (YjgF/YER057c/UK114 family)